MKVTCGIFVIDNNNNLLIVHATHAPWNTWSIPKGLVNIGETYKEAAIRELWEETGIDLNKKIDEVNYLGTSDYVKQRKKLMAFWIKLDKTINLNQLKCISMVNRLNMEPFPEVDKYKMVTLNESETLLHRSQETLLPDLIKKLLSIPRYFKYTKRVKKMDTPKINNPKIIIKRKNNHKK